MQNIPKRYIFAVTVLVVFVTLVLAAIANGGPLVGPLP